MTTKLEKYFLWVIFALCLLVFGTWKIYLWNDGYGDDAFLAQLMENIAKDGRPLTQTMASIDVVLREVVTLKPNELCEKILNKPLETELNYFKQWHPYFFLYILSPAVKMMGAPVTLALVTTLSFLGMLLVAYLFLRRKQVDIFSSICFLMFICAHPGWNQSLQGQNYVDRFFVGLGFLLLYILDQFPERKKTIFVVSLLCTLLSDRLGVIVGGMLIGREVFYFFPNKKINYYNLVIGIISALVSIYLIKFYIHHPHYSSFASSMTPSGFMANLENPIFSKNLQFFLILNLGIYGVFGLASWRYFLMAVGLMIPNIFGNIGGAEKTGFFAHYHSTYFPLLIFAVLDGFANLYHSSKSKKWVGMKKSAVFSIILLFLSVFVVGSTDINGNRFNFESSKIKNSVLNIGVRDFQSYLFGEKKIKLERKLKMLDIVGPGTSVATVESLMPIFVLHRELHLYPVGLDQVDYLVLPLLNPGQTDPEFGGAITYVPENQKVLDSCFTSRIKKSFDVESMVVVEGYAIVKRKSPTL